MQCPPPPPSPPPCPTSSQYTEAVEQLQQLCDRRETELQRLHQRLYKLHSVIGIPLGRSQALRASAEFAPTNADLSLDRKVRLAFPQCPPVPVHSRSAVAASPPLILIDHDHCELA